MSPMMDLHQGFRDPAQAESGDLIAFLEAVDGLPGTQTVHGALRSALAPRPGMRLLDAGCGIGLETRRLAWDYPGLDVVGLDRNRDLLAVARRHEHVEWIEGDLTALDLPERSFDLVRSERVLMYLPGQAFEAGVSALLRLLRPGGQAAFFELDYGATLLAPGGATDAVVKRAAIALEAALPQPWAGRRLPRLLVENGMRDVRAEPISFAVPEPVWRRIVHDSLVALDAGISAWLAEQAAAAGRGEFVAAFTGVLSTGRRARFPARSAAR
jgi:SAM-dependent methyltransferase